MKRHRHIPQHTALACRLTILLALSAASISPAAYRNVGGAQTAEGSSTSAADRTLRPKPTPPGGAGQAAVVRKGERIDLSSRHGTLGYLSVDRSEEVFVSIRKPALAEGQRVMVYTIHGGTINGKIVDSVRVGPGGSIDFAFKTEASHGNYPVILRYGGREEALEFWVEEDGVSTRGEVRQ